MTLTFFRQVIKGQQEQGERKGKGGQQGAVLRAGGGDAGRGRHRARRGDRRRNVHAHLRTAREYTHTTSLST